MGDTVTAEVVRFQSRDSMPAKLQYAKALAASGLLPQAFRAQPANVLFAVEYGDMLGLPPMAAITGIHVIEGKPTASAGLISALVRRAGHKLRVQGNDQAATCQIIRADDPGYTFEVTFTIEDANAAKLTGKDVWKKYGTSMLKARAITQCARDACEEALYGLHYTPEELGADVDGDGEPVAAPGEVSEPVTADAAPVTDQEWMDEMLAAAATFADTGAGRELWRRIAEKHHDGQCSAEDRKQLEALMTARFEELKADAEQVPASAVTVVAPLDPEDPWKAKIDDIAGPDEAADTSAEFEELCQAGKITPAHAARIRAAIQVKTAAFGQEAAA